MNQHANGSAASAGTDPDLVELIDELADRYQAGEPVDWDAIARDHPGRVDRIRVLWPAIAAMAELGSVTGRHSSRVAVPRGEPSTMIGELGDFRIIREIGRGGMGVVYEAIQVSLGRQVALKVLPFAPVLSEKPLQRFKNEAQAAAHLNHPNIVPVYAVGCERGVHYYAMQYIEGRTLAAVITELLGLDGAGRIPPRTKPKDGLAFTLAAEIASGQPTAAVQQDADIAATISHRSPAFEQGGGSFDERTRCAGSTERSTRTTAFFRTAARLGLQAAEALDYSHEQGILHRDIKPSNLLIDAQGNLWVTDFGLARIQSDAGLTMTGDLLGTLRYMSPEQALAKRVVVDHRTDIYSLGVTLYELLTLGPAYSGRDRQEILQRIAFEEPPPPRKHNSSIPVTLETIVLKAMAKDPSARYASARDLADDLRRFLNHEPIRARRSGPAERLMMWARRRPAIAALICLVALVSTVGFAVSGAQWRQAALARALLAGKNRELDEKVQELDRKADELRHSVYLTKISLADREIAANNLARADQVLDECPDDQRGWEWALLKRARHGNVRTVSVGGSHGDRYLAYSPNGMGIATIGADGAIDILNAVTLAPVQTLSDPTHRIESFAYSGDGARLVSFSNDLALRVWDTATGLVVLTIPGLPQDFAGNVAFSGDGRRIAVVGSVADPVKVGCIRIYDAVTGRLDREIRQGTSTFLSVVFSHDGRKLAAGHDAGGGAVFILDSTTGALLQTLAIRDKRFTVFDLAFSRDGSRLAACAGDFLRFRPGELHLWNVAEGKEIFSVQAHTDAVPGISFHPDGRRLATAGVDGKIRIWDAKTGMETLSLRGHPDMVHGIGFSPDGRKLAAIGIDGTLKVWDSTPSDDPGRKLREFRDGTSRPLIVGYSGDGRFLATGDDEGRVVVREAGSGNLVRSFLAHPGYVWALALSPDGRRLATGSRDSDEGVKIWDTTTWTVRQTFRGHVNGFGEAVCGAVAFSPDGKLVASAGLWVWEVRLWEAETGREVHRLGGFKRATSCVAFSPDGRVLATGSIDGTVQVMDVRTGAVVATLQPHNSRVLGVAFRPDGKQLAVAVGEGSVTFWDTARWVKTLTVRPHDSETSAVAYSPDGTMLASASYDQTVKLLDTTSGAILFSLFGHTATVNKLAFRPDGRELATACVDGAVRIWDMTPRPEPR
jgi:eukaryotic-like serine/threonine-protein kinase